jgi:thioredoxin reductase (NADPH)
MNDSVASSDVAIVGAGPIGLELAVCLKRAGVNYIQFEAHQIGYTISWWPRNTHFFSTTERIEIAGIPIQNLTQGRTTGEEYLAYLRSVVEQFDLQIHTYETVMDIQRQEDGFILHTRTQAGDKVYSARRVVIAFGDMHFPNCLGIPGEDLPHVSHYFDDPHKYFRKRLLIVGGRNSAVEAALRCWRAGSIVSISYRRRSFDDKIVKNHILPDLLTQIELGNIEFLPETQPVSISPENVTLESVDGQRWEHPADFVLLNTGFVADPGLFKIAGVHLIGEQCAPQVNPETMETNVPGLYVAGTAAAGTQKRYRLFIENCHEHVGKIVAALTDSWPEQLGTIPARQYDLPLEDIQAN